MDDRHSLPHRWMFVLGWLLPGPVHAACRCAPGQHLRREQLISETVRQLRYIALPKLALKSSRRYKDSFSPDPFRHAVLLLLASLSSSASCTKYSQSTFTIITWSLNIHKGIWVKGCSTVIRNSEFYGLLDAAQSDVPRVTPSFPVVSLADPDIICFLLREYNEDHYTYWVIEVNMREKALLSTAMYIRAEEGFSPVKPRWNFYGQYFVPSRFSFYLGQGWLG